MGRYVINQDDWTHRKDETLARLVPKDEVITKFDMSGGDVVVNTTKVESVLPAISIPKEVEHLTDSTDEFLSRSVKEVIADIEAGGFTQGQLMTMLDDEKNGRNRKSVKAAIDKLL